MSTRPAPVQLVDDHDAFLPHGDPSAVAEALGLSQHDNSAVGSSSPSYVRVFAVIGPQGSGKSTLCNALFGAQHHPGSHDNSSSTPTSSHRSRPKPVAPSLFPVAAPGSVAVATTRGIDAAAAGTGSGPTVVLDVEGADARERGRNGRVFQSRAAAFVASIADVVLVNLWYHDTGRVESAAYGLLRSLLATTARLIVEGVATGQTDADMPRTALVFVIRDVEEASDTKAHLEELLYSDAEAIWSDVALEAGLPVGATDLSDAFDVSLVLLPHVRYGASVFESTVAMLRDDLCSAGAFGSTRYSKRVPPEGFLVHGESMWESLGYSTIRSRGSSQGSDFGTSFGGDHVPEDYYCGEDFAIVAAYRCDEVFSDALVEASVHIAELHDQADSGAIIEDFGRKCGRLIAETLEQFESETADFVEEPVFDRKRRELEAIVDTGLNAVFLRQIQLLREAAIKSFKESIEDENTSIGFALFNADAEFVKAAERCVRRNSNWTFDAEREDLQNMLKEIAAQHRKLLAAQVSASEQQSQAMQFLQMQYAQLRAAQQQAVGGRSGQFSIGAAYRPPDTNVNVSLGYRQGRTSLQVSMVPDESANLLGPSGFTDGVDPGNVGLSFSLNI